MSRSRPREKRAGRGERFSTSGALVLATQLANG
jgi:hypothetical protein